MTKLKETGEVMIVRSRDFGKILARRTNKIWQNDRYQQEVFSPNLGNSKTQRHQFKLSSRLLMLVLGKQHNSMPARAIFTKFGK